MSTTILAARLRRATHSAGAALLLALAACGGGGDTTGVEAVAAADTGGDRAQIEAAQTTTRAQAWRLLSQASFGPTEAELQRVMSQGSAGWIDAQLALAPQASHLARWRADDARVKASNAAGSAGARAIASSFYQQALFGSDQLRQRVAFALSEIFVVSAAELEGQKAEAVASYMDMLAANAFGNYRQLLQQVALHPAMGMYLSHLKNRKGDPATGRVPDQNFARELMQLFSIGLVVLQPDGSPALLNGQPVATYGQPDIEGLSQVFTGFSWGGPDTSNARFWGTVKAPDVMALPMQAYPVFHATAAKNFLGTSVPAQDTPQPLRSLKLALDTIDAQPSVGPFISRQLIQRLVTSQPSPAYVARIAVVWANNGAGVRGDLRAVVRALLLDPEARDAGLASGDAYGKLREPVLRQTAVLRAFDGRSDSGLALVNLDDDPATGLAQAPLYSPSVFNFFRPGYVPDSGRAAERGLTVPEMQISTEVSVAGYVNQMLRLVGPGIGRKGFDGSATRPDLRPDFSTLLPLAGQPGALVDAACARLLGPGAPAALKTEIGRGVAAIALPALKADGSNRSAVEAAQLKRVQAAVLMAAVSPEFIVQK